MARTLGLVFSESHTLGLISATHLTNEVRFRSSPFRIRHEPDFDPGLELLELGNDDLYNPCGNVGRSGLQITGCGAKSLFRRCQYSGLLLHL